MTKIEAGTKVLIRTENGGECVATLTSDFEPTHTAYIAEGHGFIVGWRIESVEPVETVTICHAVTKLEEIEAGDDGCREYHVAGLSKAMNAGTIAHRIDLAFEALTGARIATGDAIFHPFTNETIRVTDRGYFTTLVEGADGDDALDDAERLDEIEERRERASVYAADRLGE